MIPRRRRSGSQLGSHQRARSTAVAVVTAEMMTKFAPAREVTWWTQSTVPGAEEPLEESPPCPATTCPRPRRCPACQGLLGGLTCRDPTSPQVPARPNHRRRLEFFCGEWLALCCSCCSATDDPWKQRPVAHLLDKLVEPEHSEPSVRGGRPHCWAVFGGAHMLGACVHLWSATSM